MEVLTMTDIIIIGAGPAGVSAALTARNRGKSVLIISNPAEESYFWKAEKIDNYPGVPGVSGAALCEIFRRQLEDAQVQTVTARALSAMPMGDSFFVTTGKEDFQAKAIILAFGVLQQSTFSGEAEYLGHGVSYCATCDGMLYRGKKVAVIGLNSEAPEEAEFLRSIGCEVEFFDKSRAKKFEIRGQNVVTELVADGQSYPVSCVFILRPTIAPDSFLPGLVSDKGHIVVDEAMKTSAQGVFAAGDCIGRPYQVARAVGQGNTAALSACEYLDKK
jgi:thioredoxin reductase (NADPH)